MNEIRQAKISELTPDPNNANQGTERGGYMVRRSLEKLGAGRSVLIDKNGVLIAGNKTTEAAFELGLEDAIIVPTDGSQLVVVQRTDLDLSTDAKAKELAIADNRTGEIGLAWDNAVLEELAQDVSLDDWFTPEEMAEWDVDLSGFEPPSDEDDEETTADLIEQAEEGGIESRVKLGEIWQLGRHRIACGDSTDEGNVQKLLGDKMPGMVWADAPYGISVVGKDGSLGAAPKGKYKEILGDETTDVAVSSFRLCTELFSCPQIFWGANHFGSAVTDASCWLVWDKQDGKTVTFADCELAWTNIQQPARIFKHIWDGFRRDSERGVMRVHPTQKPIALCEWAFEKYGTDTDLIFDPFLGSAPSIIAAQKMPGKRTVYGFELSPDYCEVIIRRWEEFSGGVAQLAGHL